MPELTLIFHQESLSKMYSSSSFFISRWLVSIILYSFQPLIYSLTIFAYIGMPLQTMSHFLDWLLLSLFSSLVLGTTLGILFSVVFRKNLDAIIAANMFLCFFYFSSGQFVKRAGGASKYLPTG